MLAHAMLVDVYLCISCMGFDMITTENIYGAITMGIVWVCLMVIMPITPYLTRKTECFGVSVPEAEHKNPFLQKTRKTYAFTTLILGFLLAAGTTAAILLEGEAAILFSMIPVFAFLILSFVIYFVGHKKVKAFKQSQNWEQKTVAVAEIIPQKGNLVRDVSPWFLLIYPALIIITVMLTVTFYDQAPQRIAMHYDLAGNVDRYVDKNWGSMLFMPLMQLFLSAVFSFVYVIIRTAKKQISAENPEESLWRTMTFRRIMSIALVTMGTILIALFGVMQIAMMGLISASVMIFVPIIVLVVIIGGTLFISLKVGQGGSRLKQAEAKPHRVFVQEDDKYWKLGVFYYNPDDPSLFVEKRFGIGWTSNFARPATYVILGGLIVVIVGVAVASAFTGK